MLRNRLAQDVRKDRFPGVASARRVRKAGSDRSLVLAGAGCRVATPARLGGSRRGRRGRRVLRARPGSGFFGRVVVVGDSTDYDIVAAHRVGAVGVLITTGLTEKDALGTASGDAVPEHVIHSLRELFDLPVFAGA